MKLRVVDPTGRVRQTEGTQRPSARLATLEGMRIGILLNEPGSALVTNWPEISRNVQEQLQRQYRITEVERAVKPKMSEPASADLLARFVRGSDGVVNGLGK